MQTAASLPVVILALLAGATAEYFLIAGGC